MAARGVSVPRSASVVAGLAAHYGSLAEAARQVGVGRGTLDGILSGRHGMGDQTAQRIKEHFDKTMSAPQANGVKLLGRALDYRASGDPKKLRGEVNRVRKYDQENKRKEAQFFQRRQGELGGGSGAVGGGAAGSAGGGETTSDEEWYAEYGAWVESLDQWAADDGYGNLPDVEELPF